MAFAMKLIVLGPRLLKTIGFRSSVPHDLNGLKDCRATLTFSGVKTDLSMSLFHKHVALPVWQNYVDDFFRGWGKISLEEHWQMP